jgi:hypothetical protein
MSPASARNDNSATAASIGACVRLSIYPPTDWGAHTPNGPNANPAYRTPDRPRKKVARLKPHSTFSGIPPHLIRCEKRLAE